jgi:hypothetical protein
LFRFLTKIPQCRNNFKIYTKYHSVGITPKSTQNTSVGITQKSTQNTTVSE